MTKPLHAAVSVWPQPSIIIWIATDGNDITGTGSVDAPYKTIERGLLDFTTGKQLRLKDGIYSPANTIAIDGISGSILAENPNEATIKPVLATIDNACISIRNVDRFSITGIDIVQPDDPTDNYIGLYIDNVTNFVVFSCNINAFDFPSDNTGYGIFASGSGRIEKCSVYNITGNEIYGIKSQGLGVIDCEVTALSGTTVIGIDTLDNYTII